MSVKILLTKASFSNLDRLFNSFFEFLTMPELPEVETVKIALIKEILNEKIVNLKILNKKLRYPISKEFEKLTIKKRIISINRRGKYLIINLEKSITILCHFGMTGYFRFAKKTDLIKHDHIIFFFRRKLMIYNDVRKFGFFKVYDTQNILNSKHLELLGIEPLGRNLNADFLRKKMQKNKQVIKNFLMNAREIVGIGNIYSSEILFDSRIHPQRLSSELNDSEVQMLIRSIKKILKQAIIYGGTSIKNYQDPNGKLGYFKNNLKVYGREKKMCLKCKKNAKIKKIILQNRSTFYCEQCQKY